MTDVRASRLVDDLFARRIDRRQFFQRATALGLSLTLINGALERAAAQGTAPPALQIPPASDLLKSSPASPNESPITKERVDYLKSNPYKGKTLNVMAVQSTVGECVKYYAKIWGKLTGATVNVAEIPIETLHTQIFADLSTGLGRYDVYQTAAWFYGDFFVPSTPYIVPLNKFLKDPRFPYWDPSKMLTPFANLYTWQNEWYGVLLDADAQILYYRKDVFDNPTNQKKFQDKFGYDFPNPPKTMKQMHDLADFFTGWDWNGDGKNDWGIALHAKVNEQGFFHFLTLAAPYVVSKDNSLFWFDPETMDPLIASEGHLQALEDYAKFVNNGPKAMLSWTLGQGWNLFLAGNSVMEPTWGDLPTLAQDPKQSKVKGKIAAAPIPGTTRAYDPIKKTWTNYSLNQVGNVNGGSWHQVISRFSKNQEMAYDFAAYMANQKNAFFNTTHGWTGVQPGMKYEFFAPAGTATVQDYVQQGWNGDDAKTFVDGYYANLTLPLQEAYLRIPGAAEYWHELDTRVSAVLAGQTKPDAALKDMANAWNKITDRYGKDKQIKIYQESIGYKK